MGSGGTAALPRAGPRSAYSRRGSGREPAGRSQDQEPGTTQRAVLIVWGTPTQSAYSGVLRLNVALQPESWTILNTLDRAERDGLQTYRHKKTRCPFRMPPPPYRSAHTPSGMLSRESTSRVTGPSFTSVTSIIAPKTPSFTLVGSPYCAATIDLNSP